MKKYLFKIKNSKGAISILAIGMILIVVMCMTAYVDIATRSWTLNELQSDIDTAGINALQTSIDLKSLRAEILGIDNDNKIDTTNNKIKLTNYESKIRERFTQYFNKLVSNNAKSTVKSWSIMNQDAYFLKTNNGLGVTKKEKPQIALDTTMLVTLQSSNMFDNPVNIQKSFKNKMGNKNFQVTYRGRNKNGETELIIRSVTKLVYK